MLGIPGKMLLTLRSGPGVPFHCWTFYLLSISCAMSSVTVLRGYVGTNLTLPCCGMAESSPVLWKKSDELIVSVFRIPILRSARWEDRITVQGGCSLTIISLDMERDNGNFTCSNLLHNDQSIYYRVIVERKHSDIWKGPPGPPPSESTSLSPIETDTDAHTPPADFTPLWISLGVLCGVSLISVAGFSWFCYKRGRKSKQKDLTNGIYQNNTAPGLGQSHRSSGQQSVGRTQPPVDLDHSAGRTYTPLSTDTAGYLIPITTSRTPRRIDPCPDYEELY